MTIVINGKKLSFSDSYVERLKDKSVNGKRMTADEYKDWVIVQPHITGTKTQLR